MDNLPSTPTAINKAAIKIARLLRIISPSSSPVTPLAPDPLNFEIKPFSVVELVNDFHNENAEIVNNESQKMNKNAWDWHHPRMASFALMLGKTGHKDMAHDLMVILDHSFELLREDEELRIKKNRLHVNKEFFLTPYSNIGGFLADIYITGHIPDNCLRGQFSHDYMRKLGELWYKHFRLDYDNLANMDHEKLREKYPEIPRKNWKELTYAEKMTLFEQRIIFERARKIREEQAADIQEI